MDVSAAGRGACSRWVVVEAVRTRGELQRQARCSLGALRSRAAANSQQHCGTARSLPPHRTGLARATCASRDGGPSLQVPASCPTSAGAAIDGPPSSHPAGPASGYGDLDGLYARGSLWRRPRAWLTYSFCQQRRRKKTWSVHMLVASQAPIGSVSFLQLALFGSRRASPRPRIITQYQIRGTLRYSPPRLRCRCALSPEASRDSHQPFSLPPSSGPCTRLSFVGHQHARPRLSAPPSGLDTRHILAHRSLG